MKVKRLNCEGDICVGTRGASRVLSCAGETRLAPRVPGPVIIGTVGYSGKQCEIDLAPLFMSHALEETGGARSRFAVIQLVPELHMSSRVPFMCRLLSCAICAAVLTVSASGQGHYSPPRTPDGHPDFQGFWENNIATPLQRPAEIADRPTLTDAELQKMKQKAKELFTGKSDAVFFDGFYPAVLDNVLGLKQGFKSSDGGTGDYGSEWNDERV